MQSLPPTTLVVPLTNEQAVTEGATSSLPFSPTIIVLGIVLIVCAFGLFGVHRRRHVDAHELTFRKLAKQMGFTRRQMTSIRRYAIKSGLESPVGIVMNQELVARALAE